VSVLAIILIVLAVLIVGLFLLGLLGALRARAVGKDEFYAKLEEANQALADARAEDRGWDAAKLEAAARAAAERRQPGATVREVRLVQVVDRPGTDDDECRFRVDIARGRDFEIVLGRQGDEWRERGP
jgi:hypothetical protein